MTVFLIVLAGIVGLVFYACIGICVFVVCDEVFEWEDEGAFFMGFTWPVTVPIALIGAAFVIGLGFLFRSIYQRISPYERGRRRDRQRIQALGKIDIKKEAHPLADK